MTAAVGILGAHPALVAALMLPGSHRFMSFAWYGHLKHLAACPWYAAALVSSGIALAEYLLQVPAKRIGCTALTLAQPRACEETVASGRSARRERANDETYQLDRRAVSVSNGEWR